MTKNSTSSTASKWTGMVPVDDTALAVTDTGGPGIPVVYLNGQFATQGYWRRVVAELGAEWRHITYDERARGRKSKRSADYSFEAAVRDVDAVLAARGVDRALLVGWSYGAFVAAHWASRNPERTVGAVLVDGAYPYDWLDEAMEQRIRKLFRRMGWVTPLLRPTGLTPRMTAEQQANSNIELGRLSRERELGPVLDDITVRRHQDARRPCPQEGAADVRRTGAARGGPGLTGGGSQRRLRRTCRIRRGPLLRRVAVVRAGRTVTGLRPGA
ncbi:alpha/beta fold hydrolase [Streptomyces sp. NPDC004008]